MSNETRPEDAGSFAAQFVQLRPATDRELAESLRALVRAVEATGKKGSLTLRLDVKPAEQAEGAVIVNDHIALKAPQHDRKGAVAFIGRGHELAKRDPNSLPLFDDEHLRDVPAAPVRDINDAKEH